MVFILFFVALLVRVVEVVVMGEVVVEVIYDCDYLILKLEEV
jgi:hypothetical protein